MSNVSQTFRSSIFTTFGLTGGQELIGILNSIDVLSATEAGYLDGSVPGTPADNKVLVLGDSKAMGTITSATITTLTTDNITSVSGGAGDIDIGPSADLVLDAGGHVVFSGPIITTQGNGAIVANKCTAVEGGDGILHKTTLTLTLTGDNDLDLADDDSGTGIKIYDFPAGAIQILGATCDAVVTSVNAEASGATFPMALGSAGGENDNALTSTEADIIPSTAIAGGASKDFHATLAAPILFANAAGTDLDLYLNAAITAAVASGAVTIAVTGTVTITWINLGDY